MKKMQNWVRREAPEKIDIFGYFIRQNPYVLGREAPEKNVIFKVKSLMFWREAPEKIDIFWRRSQKK